MKSEPMVDVADYIGELLEEIREARRTKDLSTLPEISRKVNWVRRQLEIQHLLENPPEGWEELQQRTMENVQ